MGIENYGCSMGPGQLHIFDKAGTFMIDAPVTEGHMDIPFSADVEPEYDFEFKAPVIQEFTTSTCVIDTDLLQTISGSPRGYYLEYDADVQIQARRHRKKRIDKKWLKRYGYKTVRRPIRIKCDQITMTPDDDDLGVRFDVEGVSYV